MEKIIVTMADVRAAHLCSGGARNFFVRYGLSYSEFLRNGIDEKSLLETGDALALAAIQAARVRVANLKTGGRDDG